MYRRSWFSHSLDVAAKRARCARLTLEPLETRQLLAVTTLNWNVDQVNSHLTIALPDTTATANISGTSYHLTARLRDQSGNGSSGTWSTGNSAKMSGTVAIDYVDGGSLQFMTGQSNLGEVDTTSWGPNPGNVSANPDYNVAGDPLSVYPNLYDNFTYTPNKSDGSGTFINNTSAPAAFGTRLNATITYPAVVFGLTVTIPATVDAGYLSLSQITNDLGSPVIPISGGSFAANSTNLSINGGLADLQGLPVLALFTVPSYNMGAAGYFSSATNTAPSGTITNTGTLTRHLTLPVSIPISYPLPLGSTAITGTITGTLVANVTLTAPTVDLNGTDPGTGFANLWAGGPTNICATTGVAPSNALIYTDTLNMASTGGLKASMATFHTGDVLAANTAGTNITASYAGGTLTLSGVDTVSHYEQVLQSITYDNTIGFSGSGIMTVRVFATDSLGLTSAEADSTIYAFESVPPVLDLNGPATGDGFTSTWTGVSPVAITDAANATVFQYGSANLDSMTVTLTSPQTGDVLAANTTGTSIGQSFSGGVLTLSGVDIVADYQAVLRTITYNNTAGGLGVPAETATVVAHNPVSFFDSSPVTSTINMPAPSLSLTAGAGSGAPNYTTTWYNQGTIPVENNVLATVTALSGVTTLSSIKVTLATFHTGDVLALAPLGGVSLTLTSSYSAGTLTLSGTDTVGHYQQALRFINYNNTAGGPGTSPVVATFVANDGTQASAPVTSTINISVGSGQVLGNRLFYNNSKYDGNNGNIAATDDNAIASDKTGYNGTGTATFANISAFSKGITGVMVDLQSGIGTHTAITAGDITFLVSPATFVTTTYNQLSTWSAGPTPAAVSVRIGAGQGGSDRLEITFGTGVVKNEWLEVNVHSGGNTGLSANDVFYFGSVIGDSGAADTVLLAKTDANDYNVPFNNIIGLTTPVWNLADYTKDGKVDGSDANTAINGIFSLHYLANPTGPFAPNGGGSAAPAASPASGAVSSGLSILNSGSTNVPTWLSGRLQSIVTSPPVTKAIQSALHNPQILNAVEQVASRLHLNEDVLDGLLKDLG